MIFEQFLPLLANFFGQGSQNSGLSARESFRGGTFFFFHQPSSYLSKKLTEIWEQLFGSVVRFAVHVVGELIEGKVFWKKCILPQQISDVSSIQTSIWHQPRRPHHARVPHHTPIHRTTRFSQKRRKTQNNYTMSMGVHRNEILVVKKFFILYINGGAQERKYDFIKIFFFNGGMKILSYENIISIMCLIIYFSEEGELYGVLGCDVGAGMMRSFLADVICLCVHY